MSNTHLKTAHDYGVQKALERAGYKNADELVKEARSLGLIEDPKAGTSSLDGLFRSLSGK